MFSGFKVSVYFCRLHVVLLFDLSRLSYIAVVRYFDIRIIVDYIDKHNDKIKCQQIGLFTMGEYWNVFVHKIVFYLKKTTPTSKLIAYGRKCFKVFNDVELFF